MQGKIEEFIASDIIDLQPIAKYLCNQSHSNVICFKGELGAGKTTLIKSLCHFLNSTDEVSSPTFSLINEYVYPKGSIYHFDLYRLNDIDELMDIGIEDYLSSGQYCLIEWPEIALDSVLNQYILVQINVVEDNARKVLISNE